jgi:mannitol-1-phosphate/altronate dehydrogenase
MAGAFFKKCQELAPEDLVESILGNNGFWSEDLNLIPDFYATVLRYLKLIEQYGIKEAIVSMMDKKEFV